MSSSKRWWGLGALLLSLVIMILAGGQLLEAAAEPGAAGRAGATNGHAPGVFLLVDTTETMGPELAELAQVWDDADVAHLAGASYYPWRFTDTVGLRPPTGSPAEVQSWLNALQAEEGGTCPDASFQALMAAARVNVRRDSGDAVLFLLSDSAPQGGRAALGRVLNRLTAAGVRVYPVQGGWCGAGAQLPLDSMKLLGQMTGGSPYPTAQGTGMTHTLMALNLMARADDLLVVQGAVAQGQSDQYQLEIEGGLDDIILQVDDDDKKNEEEEDEDDDWWIYQCLTCVRQIRPLTPLTHGIFLPLTATFHLPNGTILGSDSPWLTTLSTPYGLQIKVSNPVPDRPLPAGTWTVGVRGRSTYALRVATAGEIQMDYLGRHSIPAGRPVPVRVSLLLPAVQQRAGQKVTTVEATFMDASSVYLAVTLHDDGQHNDGAAGDGIFGGMATLPRGSYRLLVEGELPDGTPFQRMDPVPIRARPFRLSGPDGRVAAAGTTVSYTFTLTNDGDTATTYELLAESEHGWLAGASAAAGVTVAPGERRAQLVGVTLEPGERHTEVVAVTIPAGAAPGAVDELTFTAVAADTADSETLVLHTRAASATIRLPLLQR